MICDDCPEKSSTASGFQATSVSRLAWELPEVVEVVCLLRLASKDFSHRSWRVGQGLLNRRLPPSSARPGNHSC